MPPRPLHQAARKALQNVRTRPSYSTVQPLQRRTLSFLTSASSSKQSIHPRQSLTTALASSLPRTRTRTYSQMAAPTTGITPDTLTATLQQSSDLQPLHVDIQDISGGCGQSFAAVIVSDKFVGKSTLQRHRLVNGVLREEIKAIHAWTPRCLSGEQWEKEKEKAQAAA